RVVRSGVRSEARRGGVRRARRQGLAGGGPGGAGALRDLFPLPPARPHARRGRRRRPGEQGFGNQPPMKSPSGTISSIIPLVTLSEEGRRPSIRHFGTLRWGLLA